MGKVKKAAGGRTFDRVTFVWMQGETDAGQALSDLYIDSLNRILARLKRDLGVDSINIVIGRLADFDSPSYPDEWKKMRELQVQYAEEHPNCEWIDCDDLNDVTKNGKKINALHYTDEGYKKLAQRFADKAIELVKKGEK